MRLGRPSWTADNPGNSVSLARAGGSVAAVTAGLAGCLYTARFAGGSAIAGEPLLLNSIAAVIIGGVSMFGGRGNVPQQPTIDPLALELIHRQKATARKLSQVMRRVDAVADRTPEELLDYRRADGILARGRR